MTRLALACFVAATLTAFPARADQAPDPADVLASFARDYERDPMAIAPLTFVVRTGGESWTVLSAPAEEGVSVSIAPGEPSAPTFAFVASPTTLSEIHRGVMSAGTAMAQARADDPAPMTLDVMDGFEPDEGFRGRFLSVLTHFFTRGAPEVTRFGFDHARMVHGAYATPLYYGDGVRSAWYGLAPGQHVNADPADQVNDFHSVFVCVDGTVQARIAGREITISAGDSVFVPAGAAHEVWNPGEASAAFVLIMFGDGG